MISRNWYTWRTYLRAFPRFLNTLFRKNIHKQFNFYFLMQQERNVIIKHPKEKKNKRVENIVVGSVENRYER